MKIRHTMVVCMAMAIGLVVTGCKDKNPVSNPSPVATQLEGTWNGVNRDGVDQTQWTYIMKTDSITIDSNSFMKYKGLFSIDTVANPKTIDITIVQSSNAAFAGKKILGLYDLAGNVLNITATDPGTARPDSMSAAPVLGLFQ